MAKAPTPPVDQISQRGRILWGILGGTTAVGSKFIGQDLYWLRVFLDTKAYDSIWGLGVTYVITLVILAFIGAVVACASGENHRMKLLAMAISAPALITTWLGGATADTRRFPKSFGDLLAPAAFAQDTSATKSDSGFLDGVKIFFGIGKDESRYRVVVGSFTNQTQAALFAEKVKREAPGLNVYVGERQPNNEYYPVVVGGYLPYPEARRLRDDVSALPSVRDAAYLSPYRWR